MFEAEGVTLFLERAILESLADPARLTFAFGRFGRCAVLLSEQAHGLRAEHQ